MELALILELKSVGIPSSSSKKENIPIERAHITLAYLGIKNEDETNTFIEEITPFISKNKGKFPKRAYVSGKDNFGPKNDQPVNLISFVKDKCLHAIWKKYNKEQPHTKGLKKCNYHVLIKKDLHPEMEKNDYYVTGNIILKEVGKKNLHSWDL